MIKYKRVTYKRVTSKKSKINLTDVEEDIIKLRDNKIYVTKKSRMIAEARMNDNHVFSQFLVNYYTFVVLALSIAILIIEDKNKAISLLTVIASVGLFGVSLFLSNMSYKERALKYKESYLSLGELESKLSLLLRKNNLNSTQMIDVFEKYQQEYHNILSKTDNHDEIDYIKVKIDQGPNQDFIIKYYKYLITKNFYRFLFIIFPMLLYILLKLGV
ncbi:SLATT domain-containing protein [Bacillus mycoides]|uniref:SLATT domain-containing protein n=1 Tax=Bacillus mycoides TaxID=1405 RepID=UPI000BEFD215|nr:SLATT domain-containing protein [Bacillus mycoides]PEK86906.1 hypothetical protein CN600_28780 [Bacillus mycoides]